MATHSSVLAWRIPGTGEPGGLLSMGLHRVRHDWSDLAAAPVCRYVLIKKAQKFQTLFASQQHFLQGSWIINQNQVPRKRTGWDELMVGKLDAQRSAKGVLHIDEMCWGGEGLTSANTRVWTIRKGQTQRQVLSLLSTFQITCGTLKIQRHNKRELKFCRRSKNGKYT